MPYSCLTICNSRIWNNTRYSFKYFCSGSRVSKCWPVIVSLIVLPAISVPVTVKTVDDKSPPSDNILIVPFKDECDVGVPNGTPDETASLEKRESLSVDAPLSHCPNSIFIEPEPVEDVGKEYPEISKV